MSSFKNFVKGENIDTTGFKQSVVCYGSFSPVHMGYLPLIDAVRDIYEQTTNRYNLVAVSLASARRDWMNLTESQIISSVITNIPYVNMILFAEDILDLGTKLIENNIYPKIGIINASDKKRFLTSIEHSFGQFYSNDMQLKFLQSKFDTINIGSSSTVNSGVILESVIRNDYSAFKSCLINESDDDALTLFECMREKVKQ